MTILKLSCIFKRCIKSLLIENNWKLEEIDQVVIAGNGVFPPKAYEYLYNSKNKLLKLQKSLGLQKGLEED